MSQKHRIKHNGSVHEARVFAEFYKNINFIKYQNQPLYNIVLCGQP